MSALPNEPILSDSLTDAGLERDFTLEEVTQALGMSERWIRARLAEGAEHQRYGHKIKFTKTQVQKLRASFTKGSPTKESVTTGTKRTKKSA